ncbi:MAG: hypothetical protein KAJ19_28200 [Gammaproteobacteria bacterium]|nr:hypothetical protein [Gammaproteobacteria bacterium]
MQPVKIADLEAYVSDNGRDIGDLKAKDLDVILLMVQRVPIILVRPDHPEKEAVVKAALEGVLAEQRKAQHQWPEAAGNFINRG